MEKYRCWFDSSRGHHFCVVMHLVRQSVCLTDETGSTPVRRAKIQLMGPVSDGTAVPDPAGCVKRDNRGLCVFPSLSNTEYRSRPLLILIRRRASDYNPTSMRGTQFYRVQLSPEKRTPRTRETAGSNPATLTNSVHVAQSVEPVAHNGLDAGSIPAGHTNSGRRLANAELSRTRFEC